MSSLYDILSRLCQERGITGYRMCKDLGIQPSVLTDLKMGRRSSVKAETAQKIAEYFDVTVGYLLGEETNDKAPILTAKDKRDIEKKLADVLADLENSQDGLMFSGEPLDDTTKELLAASLRNSMQIGKALAKKKYTPKKYRKED